MALQRVLPSYGSSIFSSMFLYVSCAPEGPRLHHSMTVGTNIHSFLCQYLLGTFSVHIQVWGADSHLCPPPLPRQVHSGSNALRLFYPKGDSCLAAITPYSGNRTSVFL